MSTEFLRLFRELGRTNPDSEPVDIRYERERREVMKSLGYNVKGVAARVERPKFHGKMARRTEREKKALAKSANFSEHYRKKKDLHDFIHEADRLNASALQLTELMKEEKPVPRRLWTSLAPLAPENYSSFESSGMDPIIPKAQTTTISLPHLKVAIPKSTTNKWTSAERNRLNLLYSEIRKPPTPNVLMWKVYYETLADRFQTFYPHRSIPEIISKVEEMIHFRQMKESGEVVYWSSIQKRSDT